MNFLTAVHTDIGIKKKTNQDSALILEANTAKGKVLLAVICDGMGGLAKGELASATVIRAFDEWFKDELPVIIDQGFDAEILRRGWEDIIYQVNTRVGKYGRENGFNMGSTLLALLICEDNYYIIYVGDTRAYLFDSIPIQLTKDQTYVQREIDMGRMTPEEAEKSPKRNMLLQCVGASDIIDPEFVSGQVKPGQVFILCSDGFRHVISDQEIYERLNPQMAVSEQAMTLNAAYLTDLNKYRQETDNITVIAVRAD